MDKLFNDLIDFIDFVLEAVKLFVGCILFVLIYFFVMLPILIVMKKAQKL